MELLFNFLKAIAGYGLAVISFFIIIIGGYKYINFYINKYIKNKIIKFILWIITIIIVSLLFGVFLGSLKYFFNIDSI